MLNELVNVQEGNLPTCLKWGLRKNKRPVTPSQEGPRTTSKEPKLELEAGEEVNTKLEAPQ